MKKTPTFVETEDSITFKRPFPLFQAYRWVAKAASLDIRRPVLTHVLVEDGSLIALDGVRLHRLVTAGTESHLDDGWYLVNLKVNSITFTPVEESGVFPDYKKVISASKEKASHSTTYEARGDNKALIGLAYKSLLVDLTPDPRKKSIAFNDSYLEDALGKGTLLSQGKDRVRWTMSNSDPHSALILHGELPRSYGTAYVEALVMPLK